MVVSAQLLELKHRQGGQPGADVRPKGTLKLDSTGRIIVWDVVGATAADVVAAVGGSAGSWSGRHSTNASHSILSRIVARAHIPLLLECHLVVEPEQADVVVVRVLVVDSSSREDRLAVEDVAVVLEFAEDGVRYHADGERNAQPRWTVTRNYAAYCAEVDVVQLHAVGRRYTANQNLHAILHSEAEGAA